MCAYLKWDEWPTTTEDFDLLLYDETTGAAEVVALSANDQSRQPGGAPTRGALLRKHGRDAELRHRDLRATAPSGTRAST